MQGVYILKCHDYYKFGITGNIKSRIQGLQVGNPYKIELLAFHKTVLAKEIEGCIHVALKNQNISGEWFTVSKEGLDFIVDIIKKIESPDETASAEEREK